MSKIATILRNPRVIFIKPLEILSKILFKKNSNIYLQLMFLAKEGAWLNLKTPVTFNEKLNWLKNHYHKPIFTQMVDKYEAKALVSKMIGGGYIVPCLGIWDSFDEINFENLPDSFVLKATNDSSGAIVCNDKRELNIDSCRRRLNRSLKSNYYYSFREWPYLNVQPRIIAEQLLVDETGEVLRDYKFWCFDGIPTYMYITVKTDNVYENFYDMEFNPVNIDHRFPRAVPEFEKPKCFELMKELASKLSKGLPFIRIDFYQVGNKVYFGEFTFYDWGGMRRFKTKKQDIELGKLLNIKNLNQ